MSSVLRVAKLTSRQKRAKGRADKTGTATTPPPIHTRAEILHLYKRLLRASTALKYTDIGVYKKLVRKQFEKHRHKLENDLYYRRGIWVLENEMGGLR